MPKIKKLPPYFRQLIVDRLRQEGHPHDRFDDWWIWEEPDGEVVGLFHKEYRQTLSFRSSVMNPAHCQPTIEGGSK